MKAITAPHEPVCRGERSLVEADHRERASVGRIHQAGVCATPIQRRRWKGCRNFGASFLKAKSQNTAAPPLLGRAIEQPIQDESSPGDVSSAEPWRRGRGSGTSRSSAMRPWSMTTTRSASATRLGDVVRDQHGGEALLQPDALEQLPASRCGSARRARRAARRAPGSAAGRPARGPARRAAAGRRTAPTAIRPRGRASPTSASSRERALARLGAAWRCRSGRPRRCRRRAPRAAAAAPGT